LGPLPIPSIKKNNVFDIVIDISLNTSVGKFFVDRTHRLHLLWYERI
jgi:hypothetical protein